MKALFNDIEFNQENLNKYVKTLMAPNSKKNKLNKPEFLIIDFTNADPSKFILEDLDKEVLINLLSHITCKEVHVPFEIFAKLFKHIEEPNEEHLWSFLVDEIISDELYQMNTYDENLELAYRFLFGKGLSKKELR